MCIRDRCGDIAIGVDALETGNDDHIAGIEIAAHIGFINRKDACLGEGAIGQNLDLTASVALGLAANFLERHGQKTNGDLLTGRHQHI